MKLLLFTLNFIFILNKVCCSLRVERQVSFSFPGFGSQQHNTQTARPQQGVEGLVNSFLGGISGSQGISFGFEDPCRHNGGCEHVCEVLGQRRRCLCDEGYVLNDDFKTCTDIDECSLELDRPCQDRCTNTLGSYFCSCSGNHAILLPDKRSCTSGGGGSSGGGGNGGGGGSGGGGSPGGGFTISPVQPQGPPSCSVNNGGCEHKCIERRGRVRCRCERGYRPTQDRKGCIDRDECATGNNSCPDTCVNTEGGYSCNGGGFSSCDDRNGGCDQKCKQNRRGIIRCSCRKNFELDADGTSCFPIGGSNPDQGGQEESCDVNNGGCEQRCKVNKRGRVKCSCDKKYVLRSDGFSCESKTGSISDPCQTANCEHNCRVINRQADCYCDPGFSPQGANCIEDPPVLPPGGGPPIIQPPPSKPPTVLPHLPIVTQNADCGINPNKSLYQRIVGGQAAHPDDWPWMAALLLEGASDNFCGGALISSQLVLTAAHCVSAFTKNEFTVRIGHYTFDPNDVRTSQNFKVQEIRMHEKYDSLSNINDIAILKLDKPAVAGKHVQTICLPLPRGSYDGNAGIVTGWGTIYFGGPVSSVLQQVVLPVWSHADCSGAYKDKILPGMMCAGVKEGGKDSCQGDSGGPFMMQNSDTYQFFLGGVVSWGIECASPNRPGVYTIVRDFMDWIVAHSN